MYLLSLVLATLTRTAAFALDYTKPPQCNFGSSILPLTSPFVAINEKIFLCIFMMSGPLTMHSLTFQIPVDSYSSLQLTHAVQRLGVPTSQSNDDGFYVWASTPRKLLTEINPPVVTSNVKSFANSKAANPLAAWPKVCGDVAPSVDNLPVINTTPMEYRTDVISSCPFMFMTDTYVLPILSLVVNMVQGDITSLAWDNECMTCSSNAPECLKGYQSLKLELITPSLIHLLPDASSGLYFNGGCAAQRDTCTVSSSNPNANSCDPKVLVTFSGTDRNGRQLSTAGLRLSQFAGFSIRSLWDSVVYSFVPPNDQVAGENVINAN
jgi:hypothetical protein